jgi:transketolase
VQLYLGGFGLELSDLESLRTWGSLTPGHPEYGHTKGVEITTGPLGQGLSSAVGFAYAARYERGLFDPEAAAGTSPFDHFVYVIAGDGDLQEGVTSEASSLAGHQNLGNLIAIYDSNQISIEDDTNVAFTEDVAKRYEAYGWQVQTVDWKKTGEYVEDVAELYAAIEAAKGETDKPSLIILKTIIGWPSPGKQNSGKIHGSALGADELAATKKVLGFDPEKSFVVDDDVIAHTRALQERATEARAAWQVDFDAWAAANPERKALLDRLEAGELPADVSVRSSRPVRTCPRAPLRVRSSTRSPRSFRSSGAVPPTSPSRTSRRSRTPSRSFPPSGRPTSGRATRTGVCCTSASASTRWVRSSTASSCTARHARSAARS